MANSIQEQLLKAGLISEQQAEAAERSLLKPQRPGRQERASGNGGDRGKQGTGRRGGGRSPQARAPGDGNGQHARQGAKKRAQKSKHNKAAASGNARDPAGSQTSHASKNLGDVKPATAKLRSDLQRAQKVLGDSLLSGLSPEQKARKAAHAELTRLLRRVRVNDPRAEHPFNFVRKQRIKRIYVTEEQRTLLASGALVILGVDGKNHLVPADGLGEILALEPKAHVFRTDDPEGVGTSGDTNDPDYAGYEVPDDLDW